MKFEQRGLSCLNNEHESLGVIAEDGDYFFPKGEALTVEELRSIADKMEEVVREKRGNK